MYRADDTRIERPTPFFCGSRANVVDFKRTDGRTAGSDHHRAPRSAMPTPIEFKALGKTIELKHDLEEDHIDRLRDEVSQVDEELEAAGVNKKARKAALRGFLNDVESTMNKAARRKKSVNDAIAQVEDITNSTIEAVADGDAHAHAKPLAASGGRAVRNVTASGEGDKKTGWIWDTKKGDESAEKPGADVLTDTMKKEPEAVDAGEADRILILGESDSLGVYHLQKGQKGRGKRKDEIKNADKLCRYLGCDDQHKEDTWKEARFCLQAGGAIIGSPAHVRKLDKAWEIRRHIISNLDERASHKSMLVGRYRRVHEVLNLEQTIKDKMIELFPFKSRKDVSQGATSNKGAQ